MFKNSLSPGKGGADIQMVKRPSAFNHGVRSGQSSAAQKKRRNNLNQHQPSASSPASKPNFPTDDQIQDFHRQLDNVKVTIELAKQFRYQKNSWNTINEETFKNFIKKYYKTSQRVIKAIVQHIFMICDDDGDGCMTPTGIRLMLHYIFKAFPKETTSLEYSSTQLQATLCSLKEEQAFIWIATQLNQRNQIDDLSLISYKGSKILFKKYLEYKQALSTNLKLFSQILPRNLTLKQVLEAPKLQEQFQITDVNLQDFCMFRYEMNIINKRHFLEEKAISNQVALKLGKTNPGSPRERQAVISTKASGFPIYGLNDDEKQRVYDEYFRPPGKVKERKDFKILKQGKITDKLTLKSQIINALPTGKIHHRVSSIPNTTTNLNLQIGHQNSQLPNIKDVMSPVEGNPSQQYNSIAAVSTKATDIKHFDFSVFSEGEKPHDYYTFLQNFKKEREKMQKKRIDVSVSELQVKFTLQAINKKITNQLGNLKENMPRGQKFVNSKKFEAYNSQQIQERKQKMKIYEEISNQNLLEKLSKQISGFESAPAKSNTVKFPMLKISSSRA